MGASLHTFSLPQHWRYIILGIVTGIILFALLISSWVTEDAYFTFRVVDNSIHGYGLRWNIDERVQVYTNPLWMFLHIPFYALWPDIAPVTLALSFFCTVISLFLIAQTFRLPPLSASAFLLLPLLLSRTFLHFSSSGLENPLTVMLFAWFGFVLWRNNTTQWFWLTLIVALSMLNRMDTVLAYLPIMLYLLLENRRIPWRPMLLGSLPIVGWIGFSLFYYGFVFPNTKYAKLTDIGENEYVHFGIGYMREFIYADPVMAFFMVAVAILIPFRCWLNTKGDARNGQLLMIAAGMLLYCGYIIAVGGSYMSCLFMSLPIIMGLWLFLAILPPVIELRFILASSILLILCHMAITLPAWKAQQLAVRREYKIWDEVLTEYLFPTGTDPGLEHKSVAACPSHKVESVVEPAQNGRGSYYAGPCMHEVTVFALCDALLARLPGNTKHLVRVGHLPRDIPSGYLYALRTGSLEKMDPALQQYYQPLRLVISGDLWDWERLKTIFLFNLGVYDHWREEYISDVPPSS